MPTKPTGSINTGAVIIGSQKDLRYRDTYYDQHVWTKGPRAALFGAGRPWTGWREFSSERGAPDGFVTAELQRGAFYGDEQHQSAQDRERSLLSHWDSPWAPESRYFDFNHRTKRIRLRYDRVIGDYRIAEETYYQACARISNQNGWKSIEYGAMPSWQVTSVVGYPPLSPRIPQAAMAGDPWLLGFEEEPNPLLVGLLNRTHVAEGIYTEPRPLVQPVATAQAVLQMTAEELEAKIAQAVSNAMRMQKVRDAKASKKDGASASDGEIAA